MALVSCSEKKRREIFRSRGFDLLRAGLIFAGEFQVVEDRRHDYGETRYIASGEDQGEYFTVVYTLRKDQATGEDVFHIITAWRMGRRARNRYQKLFLR
jgi:uncharacterized protein